ncbi:MAG: ABC-F family ATP-binding cassette domain-containing protein [Bacteroidetes bacterium]|nr:ABC-F family ATP-binding cassette domain-containing protein [Bacteroidota bacterium]
MNLLSVENLSKSFSDKILFKEISFGIEKGEKVAMIAKNGSGKSTLMKILAGKEIADSGIVTLRRDMKVAYLDQDPFFDESKTVIETLFHSELPVLKLIREYETFLERDLEHHSPQTQKDLERSMVAMDDAHAWDYESRVKQIMSRLNVHHLEQEIKSLSGGQRKRVALARVLIDEPDLLMLDEPTNHLDVDMIEWLENYLSRQNISLLLVTHDRYFLDNICDNIIELDNGKLYHYKGNYSYFLEKKTEREYNESREVDKARNIMRTELEWIRRMPKARGTKSKARVDAFEGLKERATYKKTDEKLHLDVKMTRIGGKVLEMKKVHKSFGEQKILHGFDYTFKTGERIGIVGKNGSGKSTFLNMLTGKESHDSGKINVGDTIVFGYYSQGGMQLKDDKRVLEVVKEIADHVPLNDKTKIPASAFLTLFQFPPEMQHTFVSKLSGGEKRRLYLLTVLMKNPNFLILDEPTNDLDLITLNILEDFLAGFGGCLLVVSHDRYFMNKLVDHLFIFEGDGVVKDFNGNYIEWRALKEEEDKEESRIKNQESRKKTEEHKSSKAEKKKLSFKDKFEFEQLEKEIELLEKEKTTLSEWLNSGNGTHEELLQWSNRYQEVSSLVDEKSLRWMVLSELQ